VIIFSFFFYMVVVGMAAGWVAHLILERRTRENWTVLFLVGVIGSFLVGILGSLIVDGDLKIHPSGLIGSIVGATILLALYQLVVGRPKAAPARAKHPGNPTKNSPAHQNRSTQRRKRKRK
jgi:uncharacterized membrane protein YeaQ/YmgE (transglycosylase-associated protein family)